MSDTCTAVIDGKTCGGTFDKDGFCESCGAERPIGTAPGTAATGAAPYPLVCAEVLDDGRVCGGRIGADGFCEACGAKAHPAGAAGAPTPAAAPPPPRDYSSHSVFEEILNTDRSVTARSSTVTGPLAAGGSAYLGRDDSDDSSHSSSQTGLGAGLIMMPAPVLPSPEQAVLPQATLEEMVRALEARPGAVVPEAERFCPKCGHKVTLLKGRCGKCRSPYSFSLEPRLKHGDVAGGDYDVLGPMARGGNGWVTLARDHNLDIPVVLKSMIRSDNAAAVQGAIIERKFLAQLDHPRIAKIYRFFEQDGVGYMAMEYAGGPTLSGLRDSGPMDVLEGCSYVYAALSTASYLRSLGMSNPDNKPDNIIRVRDDIKVVDAGAMRLLADRSGKRVTVTRGYAPPEAFGYDVSKPWEGVGKPHFTRDINITTDCYTLGRTLMRLVMEFDYVGRKRDAAGTVALGRHEFSVPPPAEQKLLARYESLHRFLLRACHADPALRFQHPEEMRGQLLGVMRDIAASRSIDIPSFESDLFTKEGWPTEDQALAPDDAFLAAIKPRASDAGRAAVAAAMQLPPEQRAGYLRAELAKRPKSAELGVRAVEALVQDNALDQAEALLAEVEAKHRLDWRMLWLRGRIALLRGDAERAARAFDDVTAELPGELAPRLAAAIAYFGKAAAGGTEADLRVAAGLFSSVARVDRQVVNALWGLAACHARLGNPAAVVEALGRVPTSSHLHTLARAKIAENLADDASLPWDAGIGAASAIVSGINMGGQKLHLLRARLLESAIRYLNGKGGGNGSKPADGKVLGVPFSEKPLRRALSDEYRACGRTAATPEERWEHVHKANQVQPPRLFAW